MRRLVVAMIVAGLVGVVTGLGQAGRVAPVLAGACGIHSSCPFGDMTRTSSLTVYHETTSNEAVEPDTGETWEITARYTLQTSGTACDCADRTVQATVEVDWTGSGWTATCTSGCGGAIAQVSVCDVSADCGPWSVPTVGYELIVDLVANAEFTCFGHAADR